MIINTKLGGTSAKSSIFAYGGLASTDTVSCTNGTTTYTGTWTSKTAWGETVYGWLFSGISALGSYTVSATDGTHTATQTVTIDVVGDYNLQMAYTYIYGISKDYTSSTTTWTRTDDAVGLSATASIGTSGYDSDFDDCYPWSQMKRQTLSTGDVMVKIPKFWYKRSRSGSTETIQIATRETDGYTIHPLFKPSSTELDYVLIGAYETVSGHYSKSGYAPLGNLTRASFRTNASAKSSAYSGTWSQFDICALSAIQMLYLVEFANNNSQSMLGNGYVSMSAISNTGGCDTLYTNNCYSGRASGTDGQTAVMYRGIENLWGNVWKNTDGLNWSSGTYYVCKNPSNYADDTATNYSTLSYTGTSWTKQYITQMGLDTNNSWCMLPSSASGDSTTYFCDGVWGNSGWFTSIVGGDKGTKDYSGIFANQMSNSSTSAYDVVGSRLLYRPT